MKIKLGVIFGGESVEHEVSIISALQAIKNLDTDKYEVYPIYISKDKIWYFGYVLNDIDTYRDFKHVKKYLKEVTLIKKDNGFFLETTKGFFRKDVCELDAILPVVHGNGVEDGTLVGYLETVGIPYATSNVIGSALGQDKVIQKQVLGSCDIPVVPYVWFFDNEYLSDSEKINKEIDKLGYPVVVKPATLGSSVGIAFVKRREDLEKAINEAIGYDTKILVEKAVNNLVEVNASVLGNYEYQKVSQLEEVMGEDEILSYQDKYLSGSKGKGAGSKGMASTSRIIPARISDKMTEEIKKCAAESFKVLNLCGVCRIDFLIDSKANKFYLNEPNIIPGSLAFYLWKEEGVSYKQLLDEIISLSIKEFKNRRKKTRSFETNILEGFNGSKGLKGGLKK